MLELTFGEQVKVVLKRKGMTIKELAELIEEHTGKKMSRQNLTQRLSRDNFQEQDMRMIAAILECPFQLNIMEEGVSAVQVRNTQERQMREEVQEEPQVQEEIQVQEEPQVQEELRVQEEPQMQEVKPEAGQNDANERDITIGELLEIHEELDAIELKEAEESKKSRAKEEKVRGWRAYLQRHKKNSESKVPDKKSSAEEITAEQEPEDNNNETVIEETNTEQEYTEQEYTEQVYTDEPYMDDNIDSLGIPEDNEAGDINPYTGREYESNSVRMHPKRIGYVQVYDRVDHKWTDMTEWAFLGYQERKKALLGKDYEEPIYLD